MECSRCQQDNPPQARFCMKCGASVTLACGNCRTELPSGAAFCFSCGQPVGTAPAPEPRFSAPESYTPKHLAEKILSSKAALEGERKLVTVLFADLKGSMELLADRDPEEARKILDPVLELMMEAVHRYEGTVNQVMGDGIMALFGAPLAHEDHAVRACYAALSMQESVKQYAEGVFRSHGVPVQIRVGLNSGEVVVRAIGSDLHMDYTAVGQTTHLAARMEQMAISGAALLTPGTLHLAEGFIQVQSLGNVAIKGLATATEIFELTGANPVRSRLQAAAARGLTSFVGRDAEMDTLLIALEQAKAGQGQVVAVVGEPGVGKSRLFWEFAHSHRTRGCVVLEAAAMSYGKATTYLPVVALLKAYFQLELGDDPRQIRGKVTGKLLSLDRTLGSYLSALLWVLDVSVEDAQWERLDPSQRRQQVLDGLCRLVLQEGQVHPLVLVFEDLHWIDGETQAFLDHLMEGLPMARLLLLVSYRPEYGHGWGRKTYYRQLRIDPLPSTSADQLLEALLGSDPSVLALRPILIARTEGNPFFLEETVQSLSETGALVGKRGAYRLATMPQALTIPATVQTILAARIDRLAPEDKRLVQTAAVIGKDVPFPLLQAITEADNTTVRAALVRLRAAEFLYEVRLFPEAEYTFKHALTHEVAYGSQLQERRRELHARLLEAIEALHGDRLAERTERLAYHAVRGAVWEKAVHYCRQVGERAAARRAYREATTGYEQALDALRHLPESPDTVALAFQLRRSLAHMLSMHGEYAKSLALLGEAEALARQLDDRTQLGRVLSLMSYTRRQLGDLDGAIAAGRQALDMAVAFDDPVQQAVASRSLATASFVIGDFARAAELLRGNVEALSRGGFDRTRLIALNSRAWLALVLSSLGEFTEGRRHGEEALRLAIEYGRGEEPLIAYGCLGNLYLAQGNFDAAVRILEQGLALGRTSDSRAWSPVIATTLGEAYGRAGRLAEGLALLEEALRDARRTGTPGYAIVFTRLTEIYLLAGRLDEARQHVRQALDLARQQKACADEAGALCALGAVHTHASPPDVQQAETTYREALALAEPRGMRPLVAHCHLGLGKLYRRTGQRAQAEEHLTTATTMYGEMDMRFYLEQAEGEMRGLA